MKQKKQKKKPTFSKGLLVVDYAVAIVLVAIAIVYAFHSESYSNSIASMVDTWIGQAAVVTAFYLWKSKCENRSKYTQEWYEKIAKDDAIPPEKLDAICRLAENITKD